MHGALVLGRAPRLVWCCMGVEKRLMRLEEVGGWLEEVGGWLEEEVGGWLEEDGGRVDLWLEAME